MPSLARKTTLPVLAAASCLLLATPAAQATPPPGQPAPRDGGYTADASECLPDEDEDPPEYGPYADVSSIDEFGSDNKYLYCGDETKGVLHIEVISTRSSVAGCAGTRRGESGG